MREPYTETFLKNVAGKVRKSTKGRFSKGNKETIYTAHKQGALPRDVIKISALAGGAGKKERVGKIKHPTQKPLALLERIILASTKKNNIVLDPFSGSGTTAIASINNDRKFIGIELNKKYLDLSIKRIKDV